MEAHLLSFLMETTLFELHFESFKREPRNDQNHFCLLPLYCGRRWWRLSKNIATFTWRYLWLNPKLPDVSSPQNEGSLPEAWTLCTLWCCRCSLVCPCSDPCCPVRGCWARCPCNTQSGSCPRTGWEGCRRSGLPTASQCRGHPVGKKLGSDPGKWSDCFQ